LGTNFLNLIINVMEFHVSDRFTEEGKQKVALVDIDETICFYPEQRRYDLSVPNNENIAKINKLYDEGWKIVYWTARGSISGKDYREHTLSQLNNWGCKYHELIMGKPSADYYIDDKAIKDNDFFN
jgi:cobalamin biosynthesis Co2+ chelatase CbiK